MIRSEVHSGLWEILKPLVNEQQQGDPWLDPRRLLLPTTLHCRLLTMIHEGTFEADINVDHIRICNMYPWQPVEKILSLW